MTGSGLLFEYSRLTGAHAALERTRVTVTEEINDEQDDWPDEEAERV